MRATPESALILWLPALRYFDVSHPLLKQLARADRLPEGSKGYLAGLAGYFAVADSELPAAALTRELLAGDAHDALWLSADPAWVQPDMNGVRLLACGRMQLSADDAHALADAVLPVIRDAGMQLEISTPDRWHLKLPADMTLPIFASPEQAMGEDLSQHLPQGEDGRRWRLLLNDIQIALHQHPLNAHRRAQGLPPINSLWLWGGGRMPALLTSHLSGVISDDLLLNALAQHAGIARQPRDVEKLSAANRGSLMDLQDLPADDIASFWWPSLRPLLNRSPVMMQFASGERWLHKPWHRWRFWRGAAR
ncbi:phosphoglycerate mutase [Rhodanobacter sp. L36]|uniref:phosphoglycerate mutase n=1 Tax=Rhodanobacter sp. L36 TaxID=1747221 RepID=UPI00131AD3F4|nr:phosphoglycerate mutase [Rhodanobacter sp. L36]